MRRCERGSRRCKASGECVGTKPARPLKADGTRFRCTRSDGFAQRQCADRNCYASKLFAKGDAADNLRKAAKTIATKFNAVGRRRKAQRTVRAMKTNMFDPFLPLMIPLSGVIQMTFLKKGDKKILLIGEEHTRNFCRDRGMTPLAEIIENYLDQNKNVDFMIEMTNRESHTKSTTDDIRRIVTENKNRPPVGLGPAPMQIITMTGALAYKAMRNKPTRVHWLDPEYPPVTRPSHGDRLLQEFAIFARQISNHSVRDSSTPTFRDLRIRINRILQEANNYKVGWLDQAIGRSNFETQGDYAKVEFFKACYDTLSTSKFFIKCRQGDSREIKYSIYLNAFFSSWFAEPHKNINIFYFNVQRFFMDMYTCCRIMKTDAQWFKNIVIYAGYWHVTNYINILTHLGYTKHLLPHAIEFNPDCT